MTQRTKVRANDLRETPIKVMTCPSDLAELASPDQQREARRIFEFPGVLIADGVFGDETLDALREGLSDHRRKFKDKFNDGLPASSTFKAAHAHVGKRMRELTKAVFGYALPDKSNRSYRPMITENEPLHFDTYQVKCGTTALMAVLNFDRVPRVWNVGPSLREVARNNPGDVRAMLSRLAPGESLSIRLRDEGMRGVGPLRQGTPVGNIEFAPGAVWYANPKSLSHQVVFGGGAQFDQWMIEGPECTCPKCAVKAAGLSFDEIPPAELTAALR